MDKELAGGKAGGANRGTRVGSAPVNGRAGCSLLAALVSVWLPCTRADAATFYVARSNAAPAAPYTNWATAATSIQDAIDAAASNDVVLVTNGVYDTGGRAVFSNMTNRVAINKAIAVIGVNGPAFTTIRGQGPLGAAAVRGAYVGTNATLSGFLLTGGHTKTSGDESREQSGGGAWCEISGVLTNCTLEGNRASRYGGGAYNGILRNCTLVGNSANSGGGGGSDAALNNCALSGNWAGNGGGVYNGRLTNCTLAGNAASTNGGGSNLGTLNNCIVYFNFAPATSNYNGGTLTACCTAPAPGGTGNITTNPGLASLSHLSRGSPCIGTGSTAYAAGRDLDGEAWNTPPAMGCDEFRSGAVTGDLQVTIGMDYGVVRTGQVVTFLAYVDGRTTASAWDFGDGAVALSNRPAVARAFATAGTYVVTLRAFNETYTNGVATTARVEVTTNVVHYVRPGTAAPATPYTNLAMAATNIQDAVDAASQSGAVVIVTNGVYETGGRAVFSNMTNRVAIGKPITVRSLNGPGVTAIRGLGLSGTTAVRCAYVGTNATLTGFLLTNGRTKTSGDEGREQSGGGAWCEPSGVVTNCALVDNWASRYGGGAYHGTLKNCTLWGNAASQGGGAYTSTLNNCSLAGNAANVGGGVYAGRLTNCTLAGNTAATNGGGVYESTGINCIVYFNTAPASPNYAGGSLSYCCTDPSPGGTGNIASDPALASVSHLSAGSPCLGTGSAASVSGTDLDGEAWSTPPSMGCDELRAGAVTGGLQVTIGADSAIVGVGQVATFLAYVDGRTTASAWEFGDGTGAVSNRPVVARVFATAGTYVVTLRAFNESNPGGVAATVRVEVVAALAHYVRSANAAPVAPYTNWTAAATNIQDAIDAAWQPGAVVVVTNGVYTNGGGVVHGTANGIMSNRVVINKPITVRSLNGPGVTAIRGLLPLGTTAVRCAYVGTNATLAGFLLTNGSTRADGDYTEQRSGGGAWCEASGVLTNCTIWNNWANHSAGGVCSGTLYNCMLLSNAANFGGGASLARLYDCTLLSNWANFDGGGASESMLIGCTVTANRAAYNGGGVVGGTLSNCTLWGNSVDYYGGGAWGATLTACRITGNWSLDSGGGAYQATLAACTIWSNWAVYGGGTHSATLNTCRVSTNWATFLGGGAYFGLLADCTLASNSASSRGGGTWGATLSGCTLSNNVAGTSGGGAFESALTACTLVSNVASSGGGAYGGTLAASTLRGNRATLGGGVFTTGTVSGCTLASNTATTGGGAYTGRLSQCTLQGNAATNGGGAAFGRLVNCVLYGNSAAVGGGSFSNALTNCTVVLNAATNSGGGATGGEVINCIVYYNTAPAAANYSGGSLSYCCTLPVPVGIGNITGTPELVSIAASNLNLRLLPTSPCINKGANAGWMTGGVDLDGNRRVVNGTVDIGAYERPSLDTDGDGIPDDWEIAQGLNPAVSNAPDANADGDPFTDLQEYWADTSPTNAASHLRIETVAVDAAAAAAFRFTSSSNRLYTLYLAADLVAASWTNVPGQGPRMGLGGLDTMTYTNSVPQHKSRLFRVDVTLP